MLKQTNVNWRYCKTYATEAALMKRLAQDADTYPEHCDRYVVVRTPEGRWTAIVKLDLTKGGYAGRYEFLKL